MRKSTKTLFPLLILLLAAACAASCISIPERPATYTCNCACRCCGGESETPADTSYTTGTKPMPITNQIRQNQDINKNLLKIINR